jgi:hypothetical protein
MPKRRLMKSITGMDYTELDTYHRLNPHWTKRIEDMLVRLLWMMYAVNVSPKDRSLSPSDMELKYDDAGKPTQSDDDMEKACLSFASFQGVIKHGDDSKSSRQVDGQHATV